MSAEPCTPGPSDTERLQFCNAFTDGGQYSQSYCCSNMFNADRSCYCSHKRGGINVVAEHVGGDSFTLSHIEIRAPTEGFTSPLQQGMVFVSWEMPDLEATKRFDSWTLEDYEQYARSQATLSQRASQTDPVLFFNLQDSHRLMLELPVARSGRYVHIKLLRPQSWGENIDVQYIGLHGWSGQRSFPYAFPEMR
ncbi:hypothetical protein WJX72_006805 [[Myrmecia] bisecta]|uniref:Uncharacterized protein n=1 Tax=[Myrmecia] bisecta TaxID=41462 RepID=A0AAW1R741_9CHLO